MLDFLEAASILPGHVGMLLGTSPDGTVTIEIPDKAVALPQGAALDGDEDGRAGGVFLKDSTLAPPPAAATPAPPR